LTYQFEHCKPDAVLSASALNKRKCYDDDNDDDDD